jgi:uncharacterized surface protein with fasciclin (FAS1) repeats
VSHTSRVPIMSLSIRLLAPALALVASALIVFIPTTSAQGQQNIVQVASGNPQFSTLVRAVQAAGLADTLSGPGPFTVFAPTNDAFAKLPAGTLDSLLQNPDQLRAVLTYHVVSGKVMAADLSGRPTASSVQGSALNFTLNPARVNNANIVTADIQASNGVIHVIDTVLLPPAAGRSGDFGSMAVLALGGLGLVIAGSGYALRRQFVRA